MRISTYLRTHGDPGRVIIGNARKSGTPNDQVRIYVVDQKYRDSLDLRQIQQIMMRLSANIWYVHIRMYRPVFLIASSL